MNHTCQCLPAGNIYQPHLMEIVKIIPETEDTKTFHLQFQDPTVEEAFLVSFPGQFAEYSVFGEGEATFCISSSPTRTDHLEFSVKRVGRVTQALHHLNQGDIIGFRGPYGNYFPLDRLKGKNLVFIGGGIGLAPLRSLIQNVLDNRLELWRDRHPLRSPNSSGPLFQVRPGGLEPESHR